MKARTVTALVAVLATAALLIGSQTIPSSEGAFIARVGNPTNSAVTPTVYTCAAAVDIDDANAVFVYPLNENSGTTAADTSGHSAPGTYRGTFTRSTATPMGCPRDLPARAAVFNGLNAYVSTPTQVVNPQDFSLELWFKTSATSGRLIGFGSQQTGLSTNYDRQIYLTSSGQLSFGITAGLLTNNVITSPAAYNDNVWHHVVATKSSTTGTTLYVDGVRVASEATYTTAQNYTGFWRIGYDNMLGWPGYVPLLSNYYFAGQMRYAAVYSYTLTAAQVAAHYNTGR